MRRGGAIERAGGYDVSDKRQYRRDVWSVFLSASHLPRGEARAFLMPSACGDEVEYALARGLRRRNLVLADRSKRVCKTLAARFPECDVWQGDISDYWRHFYEESKQFNQERPGRGVDAGFDFIHADLTGCVSLPTLNAVGSMCHAAHFCGGIIVVNATRGRERRALTADASAKIQASGIVGDLAVELRSYGASRSAVLDPTRLALISGALQYARGLTSYMRLLRVGDYHRMRWYAFGIVGWRALAWAVRLNRLAHEAGRTVHSQLSDTGWHDYLRVCAATGLPPRRYWGGHERQIAMMEYDQRRLNEIEEAA